MQIREVKREAKRKMKAVIAGGGAINYGGTGAGYNSIIKSRELVPGLTYCVLAACAVGKAGGYIVAGAAGLGISVVQALDLESGFSFPEEYNTNPFEKIGSELRREMEKEGLYNVFKPSKK